MKRSLGDWLFLAISAGVLILIAFALYGPMQQSIKDQEASGCRAVNATATAMCAPRVWQYPLLGMPVFWVLLIGTGVVLVVLGVYMEQEDLEE